MFIAGNSGSGKSYFARHLLAIYGLGKTVEPAFRCNVFIIDPNGNFDYPANDVVEKLEDIRIGPKTPVILFRPKPGLMGPDEWNRLFYKLFTFSGPLLVYVDELYAITDEIGRKRLEGGNWLNAILTRGRSIHKAVIMVAQRPMDIPKNVIAQASHFAVFKLNLDEDRDYMSRIIGRYSILGEDIRDKKSLPKFDFWYFGPNVEEPIRARIE